MSIRAKILLPVIALTVAIAAAILVSNIVLFLGFTTTATLESVSTSSEVALARIETLRSSTRSASLSVAENSNIIQAIIDNDRATLQANTRVILEDSQMELCTITDANGDVVFRSHEPNIFGDSVLSQANVESALKGETLTTIEEGTEVKMAVRTGTPIFTYDGSVVGTVSVGYRMDTESFVDTMQSLLQCETTIFLGNERIATTVRLADGNRAVGTTVDAKVGDTVLAGSSYLGEVDILDRRAMASYTPIRNAYGQVIGMLFVGHYVDESAATVWAFVQSGLIITFITLVFGSLVTLLITRRILQPIHSMVDAATALAQGDTDVKVGVKTNDEMRELANAFDNMVKNTQEQVAAVEQIAKGDDTVVLEMRSEKDLMNRSLIALHSTILAQAQSIKEEHERIQIMLDATPLACRLWTREFECIDCNQEAVKLFNLKNRQDFMDNFSKYSLPVQPDGQNAHDKMLSLIDMAFAKGEARSDWMHCLGDGTLIPCNIYLVRVPYGNDFVVASYSRDLREQQLMLKDIEHRDVLLNTANRTASILLDTANDNNISLAIVESMELLGQCANVNRIHILQNEFLNEAMHLTCKHAWIDGRHDQCEFDYVFYANKLRREFFASGQCLAGPLDYMPEDIKEFLSVFEARSLLLIPVLVHEKFWGFVVFCDNKKTRNFADDEINILRSVSLMMATALNRNEQAASLREAHERTRLLVNSTPLVFNMVNEKHEIIETNNTAVELFGLKNQQEYLDHFFELSPEHQSDGSLSVQKAHEYIDIAFRDGYCRFEWMHQKLDKTPLPAEVTLVKLAYGSEFVVAGYMRDLREYKKMMVEIDKRDALLHTVNQTAAKLLRADSSDFVDVLYECMGMLTNSIEVDRMYLFKNYVKDGKLYCTQHYEWSRSTTPRQDPSLTTDASYEELAPMIKEVLSRGDCVNAIVRNLPKAERELMSTQSALSFLLVPIFIHDVFWGFVGFDDCNNERTFTKNEESIIRSVSFLIANVELRNDYLRNLGETSSKLEIALAQAQSANEAKDDFLAHMSHEMRTPLNAVMGLSELALAYESLRGEVADNLEKIYAAGSTLLSIVNDLLDVSKIEAGKFNLFDDDYETPSLINDAITQNILRIGAKPIEFVLDVNEKLPLKLYGDELRVKQIINNLLSNAFKYTNKGVVSLSIDFEIASGAKNDADDGLVVGSDKALVADAAKTLAIGDDKVPTTEGNKSLGTDEDKTPGTADGIWLKIEVRDSGIGITADDLTNLFTDYMQFDMEANRRVDGAGLGLAITKRLAEMMGGSIAVQSERGVGSTFTVRLKQKVRSTEVIGAEILQNLQQLRYADKKRDENARRSYTDLAQYKVLVVDDNKTNLDVARGLLRHYKMHVDCVTSGEMAVRIIRKAKVIYDAIFMDHMMPGMDGIEATRIIRNEIGSKYAKGIPIIALTANAVVGNEKLFLSHGFQAFLSKPINLSKLDEIVMHWVAKDNLADLENRTKSADTSVPYIEGLDASKCLDNFDNDKEVFYNILRSYIKNNRELLDDLQGYLDRNNLRDYAIAVHGIKGSSYGVYAQAVGQAAEDLEKAAKADDVNYVCEHHPKFVTKIEKLFASIQMSLVECERGVEKPQKEEPDADLFAELRDACKQYDISRVDKAMAQLERFNYNTGQETIEWLQARIADMDFDQVALDEWPHENRD